MLPAPLVQEHEGVLVVRDDLLPGGTKMRAILPLMQAQAAAESAQKKAEKAMNRSQGKTGTAAKK